MRPRILILADTVLLKSDVEHILSLEGDLPPEYHLMIPADSERNLFVALLDGLYLGGPKEAWEIVRGDEPSVAEAQATAREDIEETIRLFEEAGATCNGEVTEDDPLPALQTAVQTTDTEITSIIVVTRALAVEDTFRQDWATKAREALTVPVLRLYSGTSELG